MLPILKLTQINTMKNFKLILFSALLLLVSATVSAQVEGTYKPMLSVSNGTAIDTATNSAKSQVLRVPGSASLLTVVATVTEISGATAGTVKLYGSLNGTDYVEVDTANVFNPADQVAAQSHDWIIKPSAYTYYKVIYTPTGTMSAKLSTGILRRQ